VSDEDAFQAAIDAAARDQLPRLVFCDWLDEQGDPRADGYRVLATFDRWPWEWEGGFRWANHTITWRETHAFDWAINYNCDRSHLPDVWYQAVRQNVDRLTRRLAFDAAAAEWIRLSDEERAACLVELEHIARLSRDAR